MFIALAHLVRRWANSAPVAVSVLLLLVACSTHPAGQAGPASGSTAPAPPPALQPGLPIDFDCCGIGDRVFFRTDRSDLTQEAQAELQKQATWLKAYPQYRFVVEGHCDERGTREYNLALGQRRAEAVKNYLIALGIDANRMQTISYGKERPAVLDHDEEAWAQNRRVVIVLR